MKRNLYLVKVPQWGVYFAISNKAQAKRLAKWSVRLSKKPTIVSEEESPCFNEVYEFCDSSFEYYLKTPLENGEVVKFLVGFEWV